jgi:hypothetical protein
MVGLADNRQGMALNAKNKYVIGNFSEITSFP